MQKEVATHFSKAALTYQHHAHIQQCIAQDLLALIPQQYTFALDLGCGPGTNFTGLRLCAQQVLGIDIAPAMVQQANAQNIAHCQAILGNMEELPKNLAPADLIFSSMAMQWCNILKVLQEFKTIATPHAFVALAIPVTGCLQELHNIFTLLELPSRINNFMPASVLQATVNDGLPHHNLAFTVRTYQDQHTTVATYLAAIRAIGANTTTHKTKPLTKTQYQQLMQQLQQQSSFTHTYQIAFIYGTI